MINQKEAQTMIVDVCHKVIITLAQEQQLPADSLNIRVDLETLTAKPVFALFDKSKFIRRCNLSEIVNAGGGKGWTLIIGTYVRDMISKIFSAAMARFEAVETAELFVLLFIREIEGVTVPHIAIYKQGKKVDSAPISELIGVDDNS